MHVWLGMTAQWEQVYINRPKMSLLVHFRLFDKRDVQWINPIITKWNEFNCFVYFAHYVCLCSNTKMTNAVLMVVVQQLCQFLPVAVGLWRWLARVFDGSQWYSLLTVLVVSMNSIHVVLNLCEDDCGYTIFLCNQLLPWAWAVHLYCSA